MDLVFKRYSSPFFLLDNLIIQKKFSDWVDTFCNQINEEKLWELYLSIPIKEKSYDDWKNEVLGEQQNRQQTDQKLDFEAAKNNARSMLKNFKPY